MVLYKDATFTEMGTNRFDRDKKLNERFRDFKIEELALIAEKQEKVDDDYENMKELQDFIKAEKDYRLDIEKMTVEL